MKKDFKKMLLEAEKNKYAVGAFNVFNYLSARAVIKAAEEEKSPVIIQTSMSTVKKIGVLETSGMLHLLSDAASVPVVIHLDHCTNIELAKECIDSGWDSVMIDASQKPLSENIEITNAILNYAQKKGVYVEGEVGIIKGIEDQISANVSKTATYEDVSTFLKKTAVDAIAPAIGTAHGLYQGEPVIDFELVKRISGMTDCPVVVHGGTGLSEATFKELIKCGAAKINISTAIKNAYLNSCKEYFDSKTELDSPLEFDEHIETKIKNIVKYHLDLYGSKNRA